MLFDQEPGDGRGITQVYGELQLGRTEKGVLAGVSLGRLYPENAGLANGLVVAVTETVTEEDIAAFVMALTEELA